MEKFNKPNGVRFLWKHRFFIFQFAALIAPLQGRSLQAPQQGAV